MSPLWTYQSLHFYRYLIIGTLIMKHIRFTYTISSNMTLYFKCIRIRIHFKSNVFVFEYIFKMEWALFAFVGGGLRVVVSTAAFHARVRGSVPGLGDLKETKNVSSPSTCESQYCGKPPWPRGSMLGLRPPGLEFRILCLEDSVISIISSSSGGYPGPV